MESAIGDEQACFFHLLVYGLDLVVIVVQHVFDRAEQILFDGAEIGVARKAERDFMPRETGAGDVLEEPGRRLKHDGV